MKRIEPKYTHQSKHLDPDGKPKSRRLVIIVAVMLLWVCAIGVKLVYLQAFATDWYKTQALKRQRHLVMTDPGRGVILDREGQELARTIDVPSFYVIPGQVKDVNAVSKQVTAIVGGDPRELAERLRHAQETNKKFAWVARKVDDNQAEQLRALAVDGLNSKTEPKRIYPHGVLAAHVLGFVSGDNRGLAGIEASHNGDILGDEGKLVIDRDAEHKAYASTLTSDSDGDSVTLTIDATMQFRVEQLLAAAVQKSGAKSGTAVVLDPHTGEILALAVYPSFDPNDPNGTTAILRVNNAVQNAYEPGSTFKIVTYAAALQLGKIKPLDKIDCGNGSITVAGRVVKDSGKFGVITATEALAKSSNVGAIKLGELVGVQGMYDYARMFGFGVRTGIELPGESPGILHPPSAWGPTSMGSVPMGQEVSVTPVQMTSAFGIIANDGVRVAPHIVREVRNEKGEVIFHANPAQRQVLTIDTARTMRHMLESVTLNGTAQKAQLEGYSAAGKTGTAQKSDPKTGYAGGKHVASFVGFAPVDNPAAVIAVVIDEPGGAYHGGDVAAPVFRDIADQILPELNIVPDISGSRSTPVSAAVKGEAQPNAKTGETEGRNESLPRVERTGNNNGETVYVAGSGRAMLMPDLRGRSVRDVAAICAQMGVQLDARGNGRAVWQNPVKGRELTEGQVIRVDFARSD